MHGWIYGVGGVWPSGPDRTGLTRRGGFRAARALDRLPYRAREFDDKALGTRAGQVHTHKQLENTFVGQV